MAMFKVLNSTRLSHFTGICLEEGAVFDSNDFSWNEVFEKDCLVSGAIEHFKEAEAESEEDVSEFDAEVFSVVGSYAVINLKTGEVGDSLGGNLLDAVERFELEAIESDDILCLVQVLAVE